MRGGPDWRLAANRFSIGGVGGLFSHHHQPCPSTLSSPPAASISSSPSAVQREHGRPRRAGLQAVVADRVGVAMHQISASLARPRRACRVPLDDATDLAAAVAREGNRCYVVAGLRRSRRERGGGWSRRDRKGANNGAGAGAGAGAAEKTILKRLPPTDLASLVGPPPPFHLPHAGAPPPLVMDGGWGYDDYEARLRELQRQRDWYLMSTAAVAGSDPSCFHLAAGHPEHEDLWSPRLGPSPRPKCEAAVAAMRQSAFYWCVRDAVVSPCHRAPAEEDPVSSKGWMERRSRCYPALFLTATAYQLFDGMTKRTFEGVTLPLSRCRVTELFRTNQPNTFATRLGSS